MIRQAAAERRTAETDIKAVLVIDGAGTAQIQTGIGFFNHMLELWTRHGLFDLALQAQGDLEVDAHHTVEDAGIVLGQALKQALGDRNGIKRYGTAYTPMDEALAMAVVDISGRPFLCFDAEFGLAQIGGFNTELVEEFLRALAFNAGLTLHVRLLYGKNTHHMIEAIFKAVGRAMDEATRIDDRISGVMSTKGTLL